MSARARAAPGRARQLIGHDEKGSQSIAVRLTEHLGLKGLRPANGSVGDASIRRRPQ